MKKVTLDICGYFSEVEYYKVPEDKTQCVEEALAEWDDDEISEKLYDLGGLDDIDINGCEFIGGDNDYFTSYAHEDDVRFYVDDEEIDYELQSYDFYTCHEDLSITINEPENFPEVLKKDFIEPLKAVAQKVEKECKEEGDWTADGEDDAMSDTLSCEPWADLTMPNYPQGMVIGIRNRFKGCHTCDIELADDEAFDPSKLFVLYYSTSQEPPFLGELDAFPLLGIIYDNRYYELDLPSSDGKGMDVWISNSEDWEPLWPREEEDYDEDEFD